MLITKPIIVVPGAGNYEIFCEIPKQVLIEMNINTQLPGDILQISKVVIT